MHFDDGGQFMEPLEGGAGDMDWLEDSESGGPTSRSSLLQDPERIRAGSEDGNQGPDLKLQKGRRSSSLLPLPSKFDLEKSLSPRGSSIISGRSHLASVGEGGELDTGLLEGLLGADDESLFRDQSLVEEPETIGASQSSAGPVLPCALENGCARASLLFYHKRRTDTALPPPPHSNGYLQTTCTLLASSQSCWSNRRKQPLCRSWARSGAPPAQHAFLPRSSRCRTRTFFVSTRSRRTVRSR